MRGDVRGVRSRSANRKRLLFALPAADSRTADAEESLAQGSFSLHFVIIPYIYIYKLYIYIYI